jgi:hypothetical protein
MRKHGTARKLKERRTEARNHVNQYYNVELSIDGFNVTHKFRIWDKTPTSLSFLVNKHLDILPQLKVGDTLYTIYYPTDSFYPRVYLGTLIQHITKCDQGFLKGHYLVGLKVLERQISEKGAKVVLFYSDNGGRRSGVERRRFSYDAHIPERRSGPDRRSGVDRRNALHFRMSTKQRSDMERRAFFA